MAGKSQNLMENLNLLQAAASVGAYATTDEEKARIRALQAKLLRRFLVELEESVDALGDA